MGELYNRAEALERLGGDEGFLESAARLFVAECESYCGALQAAMMSGDAAVVQREAHTVKSMLATFSCETGRRLAMQLEHLAASGHLNGTESLAAEVLSVVRQLAKLLEDELSS